MRILVFGASGRTGALVVELMERIGLRRIVIATPFLPRPGAVDHQG